MRTAGAGAGAPGGEQRVAEDQEGRVRGQREEAARAAAKLRNGAQGGAEELAQTSRLLCHLTGENYAQAAAAVKAHHGLTKP